jgi:hypothetical protein
MEAPKSLQRRSIIAVALIVAVAGLLAVSLIRRATLQPSFAASPAGTDSNTSPKGAVPQGPVSAEKDATGAPVPQSTADARNHEDHHEKLPNLDTRRATPVRAEAQHNTVLKANLTRDGALVTLGSHFLSDAATATGLAPTQRAALAAQPPVDARKAVSLAAANLGDSVAPEQARETSPPEGAERRQRFAAPKISDTLTQLAWLPMSEDSAKLTWDVTLMSLEQRAMFRVLVDAVTGDVLLRTSLTNDLSNATFRVHADATTKKPFDSPNPMLPGTPTPSGAQSAEVPRQLVTLQSVNPTASPNGWINDGVFETLGNNVDAHTDTNADNAADLPRPTSGTQAQDAIDLVSTDGTDSPLLWAAFAKGGMGAGAIAPASNTTTGVVESFDLPDALSVTPTLPMAASGTVGGPFTPSIQTYTVTNTSTTDPLSWTAAAQVPWMSVNPAGGTLAPGATTTVTMAINSAAAALEIGSHSGTVLFTNTTRSLTFSRQINLTVRTDVDYFTEIFFWANDTQNQSWLFTPNGSSSFYGVQRTASVSAFPTDPTGGEQLVLSDNSSVQVTPIGGATVTFYGKSYPTFYVGSNGYVTFGTGDYTSFEMLQDHFKYPRIAALFDDLDPTRRGGYLDPTNSGGSVTWKQLADRIAVTYQNVQPAGGGGPNSFQIEMFFDGRVRITCLGISNGGGLIGLSQGKGVPANFVGSNFSDYGSTVNRPFRLALPKVATEGNGVLSGQGSVTLHAVQATNVVVTLASLNTGEVTVPASVTILAGQLSATFDVTIRDDTVIDGTQTAIITATVTGGGSAAGAISVQDNDGSATLRVTAPPSATEGVGTVQGMVTINAAFTVPVTVELSSSDPIAVQVPFSVVIPAGQTSAPFTISVVDDLSIDGTQTATLTAHVQGWSDGTALTAVLDNEVSVLSVSVMATLNEGATGTGTVSISGPMPTALVVSLTSYNPSRLTVPATVTLAAGSTSATFNLATVDNTLTDGSKDVLITATAPGFTTASRTTTVLDDDVHHYTFAPVPASQTRGVPFPVTIMAKDVNDVTITSYTTAAGLSANGTGGLNSITPATTGAFTAGSWTGSVTVNTFDSNVVLTVSDGAGHTGASTAFNVGAGPLHHFAWSAQPASRTMSTPVSATLTAQDAGNNTVTSFTGTAALNCVVLPPPGWWAPAQQKRQSCLLVSILLSSVRSSST